MFGKLVEGALHVAPNFITVDNVKVWNASSDQFLSAGWKQIVFTEQPEPEPGYEFIPGWKETTKKITQTWTKVEAPDIVSDSEALAELLEVIG